VNPGWKPITGHWRQRSERDYGPLCGVVEIVNPGRHLWYLFSDEARSLQDGGTGIVKQGDGFITPDLAAEACDKAMDEFLAAIEAKMPLTVARALRRSEVLQQGKPIRFWYKAPPESADPTLVIRYVSGLDYLDKEKDWLPYSLTPDDLDCPAMILVDGVDVGLDR
jgi:hypothetical protein